MPWPLVAQLVGPSSCTPKDCRFNFQSRQIPGVWVRSLVSVKTGGNKSPSDVSLSVSLSLYLSLSPLTHPFPLSLKFCKRFYLFIFRERGRGREREGEKHQCVVASHTPPTGLQFRHVPWLGIKPATLYFAPRAQSIELHQPELTRKFKKIKQPILGWEINQYVTSAYCAYWRCE